MNKKSWFNLFAKAAARFSGRPATFIFALAIIVVWAAIGPLYGFSNTWQLVINTSTTIITFLMVFLIQNTRGTCVPNVQRSTSNVQLGKLSRASVQLRRESA